MNENLDFKQAATVVETNYEEKNHASPLPENQPKKKGRPAGGKNKPRENKETENVKSAPAQNSSANLFEQLKKDIEENAANINPNAPVVTELDPLKEQAKSVINGYMLLLAMDLIFPSLIKMVFKKAAKDIPLKDLQMQKDQKDSLEPLADTVAEKLLSFVDPITLFFVVSGGMYYMNFNEAAETIKAKKERSNA